MPKFVYEDKMDSHDNWGIVSFLEESNTIEAIKNVKARFQGDNVEIEDISISEFKTIYAENNIFHNRVRLATKDDIEYLDV